MTDFIASSFRQHHTGPIAVGELDASGLRSLSHRFQMRLRQLIISEQDGKCIRAVPDTEGVVVAEVELPELTPADELRHLVVRGWHQG